MYLLALQSRRQFRFESRNPLFVQNLNSLAGTLVETAPHDDTINDYLKRVPFEDMEKLPQHIVRRLVRLKALDKWRVSGRFLVAVDGTGQLFYRHRHCPFCLTQKTSSGETLFFHHVLEAKLVTSSGLAFSIATEPIENRDPDATKQACRGFSLRLHRPGRFGRP
jgi:hypothetical protein